jgi:hypothetical protein
MKFLRLLVPGLLLLCSTGSFTENATFSFKENPEGISLYESGRPVFFYQRKPKVSEGNYTCNNYFHPVWGIDGDTLTEEFPADHPYHRGIFWAWHQVFIGSQQVADGWIMEHLVQDVVAIKSGTENKLARLEVGVEWQSPLYQQGRSFVKELTTIVVHPLRKGIRLIDFEISLRALVQEVSIGGSDDEKGYGGFCVRSKLPENMAFTSATGPVIPQNLQIEAGPWMDFSGSFEPDGTTSGYAILCHPDTPNYPAPWILRRETSMQNIVYPGRQRIGLPFDKPVVLRYRMIIHTGDAHMVDLERLQAEYEEFAYRDKGD